MDKAVLKKFAIESRQDLMQRMENKIKTFYIDEEFSKQQSGDVYILANNKHSLNLSKEEYKKRELLIKRINELGLDQVIEEAAYTWFNRIVAIRYMEIHDYLPLTRDNQSLGIRVLSSKDNTPDPEIMKFTNLVNPELDIDFRREKYVELKDDNEKFKYLLLLICKKLGRAIPQVFDGVTDYIDILVPDNLLNESGFVNKIITEVPEENYEQVEIIGWLYQYYISDKKDNVFSDLKKNIKIAKENVPAATQIFTPDWIVKYLVENTLGRFATENIKKKFKYYTNEKNTFGVENKDIRTIKFLDPCCGSGHILIYAFDVFYNMYQELGYNSHEICELILKNNLFGLDIDERAIQLTILAISLKARAYDKKFFDKNSSSILNIYSIHESNHITQNSITSTTNHELQKMLNYLIKSFEDAKEYGSILEIDYMDYNSLNDFLNSATNIFEYELAFQIKPLINQAILLSQKYDIVVTNPPYMGMSGMDKKLSKYVSTHFSDVKTDMFSVFIQKCRELTKNNGIYALITQPSWLYLKSFETLRKYIIESQEIISLLHMGRGVFGIDFGSTCFVIKNSKPNFYIKPEFFKLYDRTFQYIDINDIDNIFLNTKSNHSYEFDFKNYNINTPSLGRKQKVYYSISQSNFLNIPGCPILYNMSNNLINIFKNSTPFSEKFDARIGLSTGNNNIFVRNWFEVSFKNIGFNMNKQEAKSSNFKWFPYNKGGDFRKWFGNNDYIVNWKNDGADIKEYIKNKNPNVARGEINYFKESISTSAISSVNNSYRFYLKGGIFDVNFRSIFSDEKNIYFLLALMNSKVINYICKLLSPTMALNMYDIDRFPIMEFSTEEIGHINNITINCVNLAREDWNYNETSYEFESDPLINGRYLTIEESMLHFKEQLTSNRQLMYKYETELNTIFIKKYNLQEELDEFLSENDITLKSFNTIEQLKAFISYFIGCLFGRYSLDDKGIIYAGGNFDENKYIKFKVDSDNIIPITDEAYFDDDIVQKFKQFIEITFGKETLNENLDFIAETLGKKGTETSEETIRRYFVNDFFNDHCKIYQKKPIYWLLDSGKKNGFKALIYMHRYNENLIPKARLDYLHRIQSTYEKLLSDVNYKLTTDLSMVDKKDAQKRQADLNAKLQEIKEYDEKIAHIANQRISIDLDDGVKINYEKFKDILAKIK